MGKGLGKAIGGIGAAAGSAAMARAANKAADAAMRQVELAERNYNEVILPTWERMRDYYDRYVVSFSPYEATYLAQAQSLIFYTPDFSTQESRAVAGVSSRFSRTRQRRNRLRLKYNYGLCCHENLLLDMAEARAMVDMANQGYRYEVERKQRLDEWYWARQSQGAAMVEAMRAHAMSGANRSVVSATSGVSAAAQAAQGVTSAANAQMGAMEHISNQFSSVFNGASAYSGFMQGFGSMPTFIPGV